VDKAAASAAKPRRRAQAWRQIDLLLKMNEDIKPVRLSTNNCSPTLPAAEWMQRAANRFRTFSVSNKREGRLKQEARLNSSANA
jgi:hypothetical protein